MEKHLNKRIVGAVVTVLALAVLVPIVIDGQRQNLTIDEDMPDMPAMPEWAEVEDQQRIRFDLEQLANGEASKELEPPQSDLSDQSVAAPPAVAKQPDRAVLDEELLPYAWAVQVGAFSSLENADKYRDKLRQQGFKAFSRSDGDGLTRVFAGPELQREAAESLLKRLQQQLKRDDLRIKRYQAN
ncbi:SPOR domain-containing protein [Oceanobacter mangrovi]|uniref:SPOR domain-containing protein n=1 Tax=Oceanobacter mangrovi TaxID=2862510 RepID=UPI001C8E9448|nr:SPOR domain-containing protein [Oceanobacter mangrovi]